LVDSDLSRFPSPISDVRFLPSASIADAMRLTPKNAHHLIATYSHDIDLELCHLLIGHGFRSAGLIGSATKWARFRKRLNTLGHETQQIETITCPIGDPILGKHPQAIAVGVASRLLTDVVRRTKGVEKAL
jgi:xanthine dehydrogenase accessory factor